ncbi:protein of unknown function [Methylorubrum extorquens]|uniref:Uncharacterized protein n=1 Tax=Methylorubrum extorquens TaxID=408 RepID=A0A2N9AMF7_METEX|nr:protein of unknown function [Methylorubrum extorquens]
MFLRLGMMYLIQMVIRYLMLLQYLLSLLPMKSTSICFQVPASRPVDLRFAAFVMKFS